VKLVVPYLGELHPADARLIRLAEFLGIACVAVPAATAAEGEIWAPASEVTSGDGCCLLINPEVISQCLQGKLPSLEFASSLRSQFRRMLVHCIRSDPFHDALLATLTAGRFQAARKAQASSGMLAIAPDSRDVCDAFTGLSISAPNLANDWVFSGGDGTGCRKLITLGKEALFAICRVRETEVLLLGSGDVIDLDAEAGDAWLSETFTRFVPYVMALRHIFGDQCWRTAQSYASVLVDDPLLRPNYGFLNFDRLLRLMEEHDFKTTIAFIPHNFRRNSRRIVRVFQQNADRFSLCFHGNDHTGGEFAATNPTSLNTMLQTAQRRMAEHSTITGLPCDRIMVFPQGRFSIEAMAALRSHNFDAAVNTVPRPYGQCERLTLRELAEPAVLRYSGFPLFLRKCSRHTQDADIAFKLLFGIPILIVEHHDVFADPQTLVEAVRRINRAAPGIRWSSVGDAVRGSILQRRVSSDLVQLKAYARSIRVENPSSAPQMFQIEWGHRGSKSSLEGMYQNDRRCAEYSSDELAVSIAIRIDAGSSDCLSIRDVLTDANVTRFGFRHAASVFVRRRLSEMRDNYISKSPALLAAAKSLQRSFQR
jgi:hypothetical protein